MLLTLSDVLSPDELTRIRETLSAAPFVDGRLTAGAAAQAVKRNEELDRQTPGREVLARALVGCLYRHTDFRLGVLPHRVSTPLVARYGAGMAYGFHVDDPVMGEEPHRYRSDVSVTIFLSGPEDYQGGELVIRTAFGEQSVKLAAGAAVAYPSSSLHRVAEVTDGRRLVAVLWLQSLVRDPARRELLYDLGIAREKLLAASPESEECARIDRSYTNLIRMWSDV